MKRLHLLLNWAETELCLTWKCLDRYAEYICRNWDLVECVLAHHCSKFLWYKPLLYRPECSTHPLSACTGCHQCCWWVEDHWRGVSYWGSPSKQRRTKITLLWVMPPKTHCVCKQNMSVWPYALLPKAGNQDIQHPQVKSTSSRSRPKNVKRSSGLESCDD